MSHDGDQTVGMVLRAARESLKLTRKEVGEAVSLSDQFLYQIETGRRNPGLETLWQLAIFLKIDPHRLDARLAPKPPSQK